MNTLLSTSLVGKTILDRKALAKQLATTPGHIKKLSDDRKIPVIHLGHRTKRYALEDVLAAVQKLEVKAAA